MFYIKEKYRGSSYNQGINFNTDMLNNLPVPEISSLIISKIESIVKLILQHKEQGIDTSNLESDIDNVIFKLYCMKFNEVKIIDANLKITEAEYNAIEV